MAGQLAALWWALVMQLGIATLPLGVGLAVQAVVDGSGAGLAAAGGILAAQGAAIAAGDALLHRAAVANWIGAAVRVQQLLARKTAELGAVLTRRVAAGEVVAVSTADVEKIGWFVEVLSRFAAAALTLLAVCVGLLLYQPELGLVVALCVPVLALAPLPLLPRATRRADTRSARRRAAPRNWPPTPSPGCACCAASAVRSCSSAATGRRRRRCGPPPCAVPGRGR